MEIWENPHAPGFMFQQYRARDETKISAYEALAILKNADGTPLPNVTFFDELRTKDEEWQIAVDRFLVPLAIKTAAEKKKLPVAINVHVGSLIDNIFQQIVRETLYKSGLTQRDVLFEIVEPHVPTESQAVEIAKLSARANNGQGFTLIIDDHDFKNGEERLKRLAPFCDMVKIDHDKAEKGFKILKDAYPHLNIVLERVTFNDRETVFAQYPGVLVQGI